MSRVIGEARDYEELIALLRVRWKELEITSDSLDVLAGWPDNRYAVKLLGPDPMKGLGRKTAGPIWGALAVKIVVMVDDNMVERMRRLMAYHGETKRERPFPSMQAGGLHDLVVIKKTRLSMVEMAVSGGKARWKGIPKTVRRKLNRAAARTRWRRVRQAKADQIMVR